MDFLDEFEDPVKMLILDEMDCIDEDDFDEDDFDEDDFDADDFDEDDFDEDDFDEDDFDADDFDEDVINRMKILVQKWDNELKRIHNKIFSEDGLKSLLKDFFEKNADLANELAVNQDLINLLEAFIFTKVKEDGGEARYVKLSSIFSTNKNFAETISKAQSDSALLNQFSQYIKQINLWTAILYADLKGATTLGLNSFKAAVWIATMKYIACHYAMEFQKEYPEATNEIKAFDFSLNTNKSERAPSKRMSKENQKEMLLSSFDILFKNSYDNRNAIADIVKKMLKIDVATAIEIWESLLKDNPNVVENPDKCYGVIGDIIYHGGKIIGESGIFEIVLSQPFIKKNVFELSGNADYASWIVLDKLKRNDVFVANELLELIQKNKFKKQSLYEILEQAIPNPDYIYGEDYEMSEDVFACLMSWIDKIHYDQKKAKLHLKMMAFVDEEYDDDNNSTYQSNDSTTEEKIRDIIIGGHSFENHYFFKVKFSDDDTSIIQVDSINKQYAIKHMQEYCKSASENRAYDVSYTEIPCPKQKSLSSYDKKDIFLLDAYHTTENYDKLLENIHANNHFFTDDELASVIAFSASNYFRYVCNDKNVWNECKLIIIQNPYLMSLCEIVGKPAAIKNIYVVLQNNKSVVESILIKHNISFATHDLVINDNAISIFVFISEYVNYYELRKTGLDNLGRIIFQEIETNHGISCGFYYINWTDSDSFIHISAIRSLGIDKKLEISNAEIRENLGIMFRSSWEANIARILNVHNIKWTCEQKQITLSEDFHLPDFFLEDNVIIEIKEMWDSHSLKKLKLFHKEYPNYHLHIIDSDMYSDLQKMYGYDTLNWEQFNPSYPANILPVVGMAYNADKSTLNSLSINDAVDFEREHDNPYDENAILVKTKNGEIIGYVSADWALMYAQKLDVGMTFNVTITSILPRKIDVKVIRNNTDELIVFDFLRD